MCPLDLPYLVFTNFSALLTANAKPICSSSCTTSTPRYSMAMQPLQVHSRRKLMQSFKRVISWSTVVDLEVKDASLCVLCWSLYGSLYGLPPSRVVPDPFWVERSTSISKTGMRGHVPSTSCIDVPSSDTTWSRTVAPWQRHKPPFCGVLG
jgi:hypothetical protein